MRKELNGVEQCCQMVSKETGIETRKKILINNAQNVIWFLFLGCNIIGSVRLFFWILYCSENLAALM